MLLVNTTFNLGPSNATEKLILQQANSANCQHLPVQQKIGQLYITLQPHPLIECSPVGKSAQRLRSRTLQNKKKYRQRAAVSADYSNTPPHTCGWVISDD